MRGPGFERRLHALALVLVCLPAVVLALSFAIRGVGADPIETLTHASGEWAIRFLFASLAITPLRRLFGWRFLAPLRRTFGLAAFAWAAAHLLVWSVLDHALDPAALAEDLTERPYVMAGMAAFSILAVLAATSTRRAMKRLGRRWVPLHRLVYAAGGLALLHHFWLVKADYRPPSIHAAVLAVLLGVRLVLHLRRRTPEPA